VFGALTFSSALFVLQGQMASLFFTRSELKFALSVLLTEFVRCSAHCVLLVFALLKFIGHELHNYDGVFSVQLTTCCNAVKLK